MQRVVAGSRIHVLVWSGLAFAVLLLGMAGPARAFQALSWSAPVLIDHAAPLADPEYGGGVSCPSVSFCIAVDQRGNAVTTRDPARASSWSAPRPVFPVDGITASVSCPSASMCVADNGGGLIAVSSNPAGRAPDWRIRDVTSPSDGLVGVSCPSVSLCVAVDSGGDVISSRDPASRRAAWKVTRVEAGNASGGVATGPTGVACPSVRLCVVIDRAGRVLTSTDPAGGNRVWRRATVVPGKTPQGAYLGLAGIACPSARSCVAVSGAGEVASTRDPTGGAGAWTVTKVGALRGAPEVACVSVSFCVAAGLRSVAFSRQPTAGKPRWTARSLNARLAHQALIGIACPSMALCVAITDRSLVVSRSPTRSASSWRVRALGATNELTGVSCTSASACVAVDDAGHAVTTTDPSGGASAWRAVEIAGGDPLDGVSCVAGSLCAAVDGSTGKIFVSDHPTASRSRWTAISADGEISGDGAGSLYSVSCPTASLCVALDSDGNAVTSTDPEHSAGTWRVAHIDSAEIGCDLGGCPAVLGDISCPTANLCVALDNGGNVITSTDPSGGASAWVTHAGVLTANLESDDPPSTVSCTARPLCVVASPTGMLEISTDPTGAASAWDQVNLHDASGFTGISCTTTSCAVVDHDGSVLSTPSPVTATSSWKRVKIDGNAPMTGITCAGQRSSCVAIDDAGDAAVAPAS
jgi:hypothetical protein